MNPAGHLARLPVSVAVTLAFLQVIVRFGGSVVVVVVVVVVAGALTVMLTVAVALSVPSVAVTV